MNQRIASLDLPCRTYIILYMHLNMRINLKLMDGEGLKTMMIMIFCNIIILYRVQTTVIIFNTNV